MNDLAKNIVLWIVIAVVVATVVSNFSARSGAVQEIAYSTFLEQVKDGGVSEVTLNKVTDVIQRQAHERRSISWSTTPRPTTTRSSARCRSPA